MNQQQQKLAPVATLSDGNKIPLVGLGTFQIASNEQDCVQLIKEAYKIGYRHFDTAILYGNEENLGKAFQALFKDGVKREEIFVTTKAWIYKESNAIQQLKEDLKKLQLDYVDLFLLHWPICPPKKDVNTGNFIWTHKPIHQSWSEYEECKKLGLTKSIGVSNFNVQSLADLLCYCKYPPTVNQIELSPYLQQKALVEFCKKVNIHVTGYGNLARGGTDVHMKLGAKIDIFNDPILKEVAQKYNKTLAQVCLAMWVQQGVSVIPKSNSVSRLTENFDAFGWQKDISKEDLEKIEQIQNNIRTCTMRFDTDLTFFDFDCWA